MKTQISNRLKTIGEGLLIASLVLAGGVITRAADETQDKIDAKTADTITLFKKTDTKMQSLFDQAYGYAVFPTVSKGGAGIGAAHGNGEVFEHGKLIGTVTLTQVTVGAQLGGQEYSELIFFETREALDHLRGGTMAISAQASAVAAAEGASANAKYEQGALIFTLAKSGLMTEASIGGQKLEFVPIQAQ